MMHDRKYQEIIENICREIQPYAQLGRQADYIPALASVDPDKFGIYLSVLGGDDCMYGDYDTCFSIQSIAKVFSLAIALSLEGENLWMRIGKEPSGTPFNSLVQLEYEHGRPRNPFITAGALVVADVLLSHLDDAQEFFIQFVRQLSGSVSRNSVDGLAKIRRRGRPPRGGVSRNSTSVHLGPAILVAPLAGA